jgi:hypothetical protein
MTDSEWGTKPTRGSGRPGLSVSGAGDEKVMGLVEPAPGDPLPSATEPIGPLQENAGLARPSP